MAIGSMFNQSDILGVAMQAAVVRNDVISNNIANADTPGFKKSGVKFESLLASSLNEYKKTGKLDLSRIKPTIAVEFDGYNYRIDENNVDIESEMVDLYQNSVKYDVLARGVMNNYKRINLVISAK